MTDFFYSDPHFWHSEILNFDEGRPFENVEQMNDILITYYNCWVGKDDTTIWTGDCFFCSFEKAEEIMSRLHGKKILVRGNHDRSPSRMAALGFDIVVDIASMHIAGHPVEICHYPYRDGLRPDDKRKFNFPMRKKGFALIHGHTHSRKQLNGNMIHVGVDAWNYQPVPMSDVEALVRQIFRADEEDE